MAPALPGRRAARARAVLSTSLFTALALSSGSCGGDGGTATDQADASTDPGEPGDSSSPPPTTIDIDGCIVSVLATDCGGGLPVPHEVELVNAKTGQPLPGFKTTSAPGGKYAFKNVPGDIEIAVHAIGVGPVGDSSSTYDSIALYVREAGDNLLRVSSVGTAGIAGTAADFTPNDDKAALSGAVYQVDAKGKRIGQIGCAQIYLDDLPHPATSVAQRYNAANGIPTTLRRLDKTLTNSGRFYFGNLPKGQHTLRVTLDDGKTFIAERSVFVGKTRAEAGSPYKSVLYLVGIDVEGPNPTPTGCPSEEAP